LTGDATSRIREAIHNRRAPHICPASGVALARRLGPRVNPDSASEYSLDRRQRFAFERGLRMGSRCPFGALPVVASAVTDDAQFQPSINFGNVTCKRRPRMACEAPSESPSDKKQRQSGSTMSRMQQIAIAPTGRGLLSLRDPTALAGRSGHPISTPSTPGKQLHLGVYALLRRNQGANSPRSPA